MSEKYTVGRIEQLTTKGTDRETGLQLVLRSEARKAEAQAYIAGLRRAAEIATDENCDQTEYRCLTIERIGKAIEREASKLEREGV